MNDQTVASEDSAALLKISLAEFVIEWNNLEKTASLMLFKLAGGDARVEVLTARLQSSSLVKALTPLSHIHPDPLRSHIQTFAKLFDRLRAWRNLYVHGVFQIVFTDSGEAGGLIQDAGIRGGKLTMTEKVLRHADLDEALEQVRSLKRYIDRFIGALWEGGLAPVDWEKVVAPSLSPDLPGGLDSPFLELRRD